MTKNKLPYLEMNVTLNKKKKIATRMIIVPASKKVAEKRIKDATTAGKRKNDYTPSKEYRIKANYNIFITNVPEEVISITEIPNIYSLRSQIELIFKTWKSIADINKVKKKKNRFGCQLYAKLIWIIINWKFYQASNTSIKSIQPDQGCSVAKFFKQALKFTSEIRRIVLGELKLEVWIRQVLIKLIPNLLIEKRMDKKSHIQVIGEMSRH